MARPFKNSKIVFKWNNKYEEVFVNQVIYFEAGGPYTKIQLKDKTFEIAKGLKEIECFCKNYNFIRIHKSYLINKKYFRKLSNTKVYMRYTQMPIPISVRKLNEVKLLINIPTKIKNKVLVTIYD